MQVRRLDANHDMTFGAGLFNLATAHESVAQNLQTRLLILLGEWFLDTSAGIPYLQSICVKPANVPYAMALLEAQALGTDEVVEITNISLDLDRDSRLLSVVLSYLDVYSAEAQILTVPLA